MICPAPLRIENKAKVPTTRYIDVPCGRCHVCRNNRRNEWTTRIIEETKIDQPCIFLTLTYNEENLPYKFNVLNDETILRGFNGSLYINQGYVPTLYKKDIQDFLKRFRKAIYPRLIRYYIVGEYGEETQRPHYHGVIFNCDRSDDYIIQSSWKLGNIHVGMVSPDSIAYVTKHHLNENGSKLFVGQVDSFCLMSRRPGIGLNYVDIYKSWHNRDIIKNFYYPNYDNKRRLPRIYKERIFTKEQKRMVQNHMATSVNDLRTFKGDQGDARENYKRFKMSLQLQKSDIEKFKKRNKKESL